MVDNSAIDKNEKKSLNFIEELVEKNLSEGINGKSSDPLPA